VYSARYSGEHATYAENVSKVLAELDRVGATSPAQRAATFRSVAFVAYPDGGEMWAEGTVAGVIAPRAVGGAGFGYDPVFVPDDCGGRTFAQMEAEEKHRVSHRGRAFRALAELLGADPGSS
jgi:XTP/dITP diphosphohydrolase